MSRLAVVNWIIRSSNFCFVVQLCAQVTGANKGIGFAIVKRLCKEFQGDVLLTGRVYLDMPSAILAICVRLCMFAG